MKNVEYGYVPTAREPMQFEIDRNEAIEKLNKMLEKKERLKVIGRKAGTATLAVFGIAAIGAMAILGSKLPGLQEAQSQKANADLYANAYVRDVTEETIINNNKEFYEDQKETAINKLATLTIGTPEYRENQALLDDAELNLMGINDILDESGKGISK